MTTSAVLGAIIACSDTKSHEPLLLRALAGGIGGLVVGFIGSGVIVTLWQFIFGPLWDWISKKRGQETSEPVGCALSSLLGVTLGTVIGGIVAKEYFHSTTFLGAFLGGFIGIFAAFMVVLAYSILWPGPISGPITGRDNEAQLPFYSRAVSGPALGMKLMCLVIAHIPVLCVAYVVYLSRDWTIGYYYGTLLPLLGGGPSSSVTQTHHGWTTVNPQGIVGGIFAFPLVLFFVCLPVALGCICYYYYFRTVVLRVLKRLGLSR
jgi:hypothetical protein